MIAKPEWTKSNAQQNTEQLQNPTLGAAYFTLLVATSVKQWSCATLIVYNVIYKYPQIFLMEEFSFCKVKYICR